MITRAGLARAIRRYLETWWAPVAGTIAVLGVAGTYLGALTRLRPLDVAPNAYLDLAASRALGLLALAILAGSPTSVALEVRGRRWRRATRALVGLVGTLILMLPTAVLVTTVETRAPLDVVYSGRRGAYYVLTRDLVWTDTVYQIYRVPRSLWRPVWQRAVSPTVLDYSEDGTLTEGPRLLLSRDESLLVVARGGHKTDAIELDQGVNLVGIVPWTAPDREDRWGRRTAVVDALLEARGGASE